METLLRPVIISTSCRPAATASSTTYWMAGLSTTGSISLGIALVAGRNRVPRPAAGITALRTAPCSVTRASSRWFGVQILPSAAGQPYQPGCLELGLRPLGGRVGRPGDARAGAEVQPSGPFRG